MATLPKPERLELMQREWDNHKFREGEYFDRYLWKLLKKYDLDLDYYYQNKRKPKGR